MAALWRRGVEVWNRVGDELLSSVFVCMSSSKEGGGGEQIKTGEDVTLNSTAYKCQSVQTIMETIAAGVFQRQMWKKNHVKLTREKEWRVTSGGHACTQQPQALQVSLH